MPIVLSTTNPFRQVFNDSLAFSFFTLTWYRYPIPFAWTFSTMPFEHSTFRWFAHLNCMTYAADQLPSFTQHWIELSFFYSFVTHHCWEGKFRMLAVVASPKFGKTECVFIFWSTINKGITCQSEYLILARKKSMSIDIKVLLINFVFPPNWVYWLVVISQQ